MSHSHLRCLGCSSSNIIEDKLYCEEQLVCVDCGTVVPEAALVSQSVNDGACTDVSYSQNTAEAKKPCQNLIRGLQRMKALCGILRINRDIRGLSRSYYVKAYQHKSFINVSLQKKEILAGCCLFVSCRLLNWPISMVTISGLLDADPTVMVQLYHEMIKILNIKAPIVNVNDEMEAHIHDSIYISEELSESHKDLTKRAPEQVELAEDTCIVTGRKPIPIMAATDTEPQSQDPAPNWRKRARFAAPCVFKAKKSRVEQPEIPDVTGDEDISDSEIDTEIRTPKEV